jgi:DNA-directed RNA polymerase subunit RPC12/RpoP
MPEQASPPSGPSGIDSLLTSLASLGRSQQLALLRADQRRRWTQGNRLRVEDYLRHLGPAEDTEAILDLIYAEVLLREEQGQRPRQDEYVRRFPRLAEPLARQFAIHQALPGAAPSGGDSAGMPTLPRASAMLIFACTTCGQKLKVSANSAGKKVQCPACRQVVQAPPASPAAPAAKVSPPVVAQSPTAAPGATVGLGEAIPGAEGSDRELSAFLAPAQAADELGRLGPYRVLKVLGHGGMGVVFQAEDPQLQRLVALKAMLPGMAASDSARQRFLRESASTRWARTAAPPSWPWSSSMASPWTGGWSGRDGCPCPRCCASGERCRGSGGGPRARVDPPRRQAGQRLAGGPTFSPLPSGERGRE